MAKQKKNANYLTDKNIAKKEALDEQKRKKENAKNLKTFGIIAGSVVGVALVLLIVLWACGAFNYYPEGTMDAAITFDNGTTLHFELYGEDAPTTVEHFKKLYTTGFFKSNLTAHTFLNGLLYFGDTKADGGSQGIKGEFDSNGFKNKVKMEKGVICLARGEGKNSGYGQFFILTENSPKLQGEYTAFGKITDYSALEKLLDSIEVDANGNITNAPVITSVDVHASHSH